ncbi:xaa-Pro aminopeptidase 1 [Contarinia nasturtii]|uniref:xaa-Pro aminopeptidase 1 n=1 Tax=Contarinia nasturtii TaxID=265458 RepID=UPI0012D3EA47|nr:xaa-Pro aminopeptidase 1 [Contarinia nasturtii]XP_031640664.1 xaa-Pro aminopeptidase 1 [Contarinia nasturtii]XP_031640665.1 xaa-Pro aminopeptidase 1 [Contarinia nasturtii]
MNWFHHLIIVSTLLCPIMCHFKGIQRIKCESRIGLPFRPHSDQRHRVDAIREEMKSRASMHRSSIDAYIVTTWDEHLNEDISDHDKRTQFISGFTGKMSHVVITLNSVALWTDDKYLAQANAELNCDWKIFSLDAGPDLISFILSKLDDGARVGAHSRTVPHKIWHEWKEKLQIKSIRLLQMDRNLIDSVWLNRPPPNTELIKVQPVIYAGEKWQSKIKTLRQKLAEDHCDAIIVTSLTEIAYLLNLRGNDLPYTPVFKAYLLVTQNESILYVNKDRIDLGINYHLNSLLCNTECVKIKDYDAVWRDLKNLSYGLRKILVPSHCVFDFGVSEAIYSSILISTVYEKPSPVIFMRARKNPTEQKGMHRAHILDGAAMCDALSLLERRFLNDETVFETSAADDIDRARYSMKSNRGLSFKTNVAFGAHGAFPHWRTSSETDTIITDKEPCIFDSGGQYAEGTTIISRTVHFGEPTFEQKQMYTNVLKAIIRLSTLVFPENLTPGGIDALARSSVWDSHTDYPQITGHGVGSFLSVQESPIKISYAESQKFTFEEGYFFSNEPGLYKKGLFGIRLKNVLEVYDTGDRHPSGTRFLGFRDVSLVPFDPKMIDRGLLNIEEKRWLNEYNARVRSLVGEELKSQYNMQAFYWMINKTKHVIEYYPESEYRQRGGSDSIRLYTWMISIIILNVLLFAYFFN